MHWHVFKMANSKSSMRSFVFWFCYKTKKATNKTLHKNPSKSHFHMCHYFKLL